MMSLPPEDDKKTEPIEEYKVLCPKCRAESGKPCRNKHGEVDYFRICIARMVLYKACLLSGTIPQKEEATS